jgi:hypothetical protein
MRLSLLLKREPFGDLLVRTLSTYWSNSLARPVGVRWGPAMSGEQIWRGNIYLNFFCVHDVDPACFEVIVCEFGHARSVWRRGLQSAYVHAAVTQPLRKWLSQVCFVVSQSVPAAEEKLLIGGNRRLRIIQPRCGRSTVIHKCGYSRIAFERETAARLGAAARLAPRFHGIGTGGLSFEEDYFVGTPANRLGPKAEHAARETAQVRLIAEVHRPTLRVVGLADRLCEVAEACAYVAPAAASSASELAQWAVEQSGKASVGLALSHGDFQDANILVASDRLHVIDWEAAAERSQLYDLATLSSGVRLASDGLQAWKACSSRWAAAPGTWPVLEVPVDGKVGWLGHAALWWLEESLLRLEESRMAEHVSDHSEFDVRIAAEIREAGAHLRTL